MKTKSGQDIIQIHIWESIIDLGTMKKTKGALLEIIELPISFIRDGRTSRTTAWYIKHVLDESNKGKMVEIHFDRSF